MTLSPGTTFAGRYQIARRLAEGGMGAVYEVIHVETGRRRALKVLHPHVLKDRKAREQFRREARIGGVIESDSVVDVFDAGIDDATGTPFLVMELLKGEDLGRRIERYGPMGGAMVVTWLRQASFALDKAHRAGVVHRDLKPDNLFLHEREQGAPQIKILDFGVAKIVRDANQASGDTLSVGTPMFMAPEQFTGSHPVTGAADRYALAQVAYMLLVGEPYFDVEAEQSAALLAFANRVCQGATEPPSQRARARRDIHLPRAFDAWFLGATQVDPDRRPASACDLVDRLERALGLSLGEEAPTRVLRADAAVGGRVVVPVTGAMTSGSEDTTEDGPPVGAHAPPMRFGSSISGTSTPHRPQKVSVATKVVGVIALGLGGVVMGLGVWAFVPGGEAPTPAAPPYAAPPQPEPRPTVEVPSGTEPPADVASAPVVAPSAPASASARAAPLRAPVPRRPPPPSKSSVPPPPGPRYTRD